MLEPVVAIALLLMALLAGGLLVLGVLLYKFVTGVMRDQREFSKDLLGKVLLYQKSDNAEQAVALDINAEALRDAIAKAEYEEQKTEKALEPKYAHTADGTRIDLREWEIL